MLFFKIESLVSFNVINFSGDNVIRIEVTGTLNNFSKSEEFENSGSLNEGESNFNIKKLFLM